MLDAELGRIVGFFKRHGTRISWAILIAALVALVAVYVSRRMRRRHFDLRQDFAVLVLQPDTNIDPQERVSRLEALAKQDDDKHVGAMAQVALGDTYAGRAIFAQGGADRKSLTDNAADCYRQVITRFPGELLAVAKVRIGLARLAENRGDFEAAKAEYEAVRQMPELQGQPVLLAAARGLREAKALTQPVRMVASLPAESPVQTHPAEAPTMPAATRPDQPATSRGE